MCMCILVCPTWQNTNSCGFVFGNPNPNPQWAEYMVKHLDESVGPFCKHFKMISIFILQRQGSSIQNMLHLFTGTQTHPDGTPTIYLLMCDPVLQTHKYVTVTVNTE